MNFYFYNKKLSVIVFFLVTLLLVGNAEAKTLQANARVTGTVTSVEDNQGLPGVTVLVQGTQIGTVTNTDGEYAIEVTGSNPVLVFSYVGYETQEVPVNGRSTIDVTLALSLESLQEVVVTALGIEREERSLGYSVTEVEGEDLTHVAQENVLNSLAGRVPGVQINQVSGAGSSTSIIIRGATSLTSDNQPLFVVDGVPLANSVNNIRQMGDRNQVDYGNAISDINPEDIETISVLKGPSAAALYGSRAGNGVILITTKSGKKGKGVGVSVSSNTVFEMPYRYLDFHYKYGPGEFNNQLDENSAYWGGPALDAGIKAVQWNSPLDENGNPIPTELKSYPDNMKNFLQTGITSINSFSFSNATDNSSYRLSYTNMSSQGIIPNSDLFRNNISVAGSHKIVDNLTLSTNINFARSNSNDRPATGNRGANPLQAVYAYSHADVREMRDYWVEGQEQIQQKWVSSEADNPYFVAYGITNAFVRDRIFGNVALDWQITPEFSLSAKYALDRYDEERETKIPWSYRREPNGGYYLQNLFNQEINTDFLASYNKVTSDFDISVSFGGNILNRQWSNNYAGSRRGVGIIVPGLFNLGNIPSDGLEVSNASYEKAIYSLYGLASFGYKDMVYLDVTGRNDWSSTLPSDNRSYFYPSASLSVLTENIFSLPEEISLAKLRVGWAQVGNDTNPYQLEPVLGTGNWGNLVTTSVSSSLLNQQLKPEIATSIEGGIDFNMYNNRLRFSGTFYKMENKNQILGINVPRSSGYNQKLINAGLIESTGWEFVLGFTPISTPDWNWDVNLNLTQNSTKVKELAEGIDFIQLWSDNGGGAFTFVGEKIGDLYSRGYATVDDPNSEYYGWPIINSDGDAYESLSGVENMEKVGNFNPDFILGGQTSVSYKNFTLSASFDWRQGGEFMSYTYRYGESDWKSQRQLDILTPSGITPEELKADPEKYIIPTNGHFPRVGGHTAETGGIYYYYEDDGEVYEGNDGGFVPGVYVDENGEYVENLGGPETKIWWMTYLYPWSYNKAITFDASFIKLRELSLAYNLPNSLLDGLGIQNASISVYTRNIMLWNKADIGIDPERAFEANSGTQGNTVNLFRQGLERQNVYPFTMPIGFKLNFNF